MSDVAERDIRCEHDLPRPVRVELRELERDLDEARISPVEYDALVEALLVAVGVPVARTDD